MHQQRPRCRGIEPAKVQYGLGLTCSHKMPLTVSPSLDPRVVVVGVCPARGIDLTGGDAYGTQGGNSKRRFLTTAPDGGFHASQRGQRTRVARLIGHMLMTPVVHLKNRLLHAHALNTLLQFLEEHGARHVKRLVVHAQGQHEMIEQQFRNGCSPRHLLACFKSCPHIL